MTAAGLPSLIGLDVGTHSIRALAFDEKGRVVAVKALPTPNVVLGPGMAEYEPEALWETVTDALTAVAAQLPAAASIQGLAVASVGESCVLVDPHGAPVHRAIAWFDRRTVEESAWLQKTVGAKRFHGITGLPVDDPSYGLCKLLWLRNHACADFERGRHALNIADWIAFKLSGEMATDFSLASRTGLLDIHRLQWSRELFEIAELPYDIYPQPRASGTALGPIKPAIASATGLRGPCIVGVGGHDHVCGGFAAGAHRPGVLLDSMGTAEALLLYVEHAVQGTEVLRTGFLQGAVQVSRGYGYVGGAIYSSGGSVEWFRDNFASSCDYDVLIGEASTVAPGSDGVCFLPHLAYSPPPHPDPKSRGGFAGLTTGVSRGDMFRAMLEGLALEARVVVEGISTLPGLAPPVEIRSIGGSTRNALWMKIKASVYGKPLVVIEEPEATALGAAMLGGLAGGTFHDQDDAVGALDQNRCRVDPDPQWQAFYEGHYRHVYRLAYEALRPLNHAIAEFQATAYG